MNAPAFAVGIDLGTTHCALAQVALGDGEDQPQLEVAAIPQLIAPGEVASRPLLPSFVYLPHASELAPGALGLPWPGHPSAFAVGEIARSLGAKSALRMVSSAKSWLCNAAVDRRAPLLPIGAPDDLTPLSPLAASAHYLEHLRRAWDHAHPEAPLDAQVVTLAVPASFDPAARELTAEAARLAGLGHAVLLEEPQAALYSWLGSVGGGFRDQVHAGDTLLVLDVGGGTSDFSMIAVRERAGDLELERIAVGDHILLGGDNMDLALAYFLKGELEQQGQALDAAQLVSLTQAVRVAKEQLLNAPEQAAAPVVIAGRGSRLIGGTIRSELKRADLERVLLEGFFPKVAADARPEQRPRAALSQLGLPYAHDAAITRHLAAFLARQTQALGAGSWPSAVLFNGGVFKSPLLRERVLEVINGWLAQANAPAVRVLQGEDLDLGVARGSAYYGYVRTGHGIRIRGGTAMAYYVGVESAQPAVPGFPPPMAALCVAPFGLEEGSQADMPATEFGLLLGEPVRFRFSGSSVRRQDRAGDVLPRLDDEALTPLSDIEVTLQSSQPRSSDTVIVRLQASVTEVGTLRLEAVERGGGEHWKIELDTRDSSS